MYCCGGRIWWCLARARAPAPNGNENVSKKNGKDNVETGEWRKSEEQKIVHTNAFAAMPLSRSSLLFCCRFLFVSSSSSSFFFGRCRRFESSIQMRWCQTKGNNAEKQMFDGLILKFFKCFWDLNTRLVVLRLCKYNFPNGINATPLWVCAGMWCVCWEK